MFAFLRGEVAEIEADSLVLDVAGVGYALLASSKTLGQLAKGSTAKLYTHLHLSQDAVALYAFISKQERQMFLRLISVSRVGPKLALAVLSSIDPAALAAAIVSGDEGQLSRVPGMGKKTAQRVILELKEKIAKEEGVVAGDFSGIDVMISGEGIPQEALAALIALGYDSSTASRAVSLVQKPCATVEEMIKAALRNLA